MYTYVYQLILNFAAMPAHVQLTCQALVFVVMLLVARSKGSAHVC